LTIQCACGAAYETSTSIFGTVAGEEASISYVTPTFYKNKKICANRGAYKNAYQIIVHMKNFPKINLV
jgi:hypothetical protein